METLLEPLTKGLAHTIQYTSLIFVMAAGEPF